MAAPAAQTGGTDWPQWRGPQRNGEATLTAPATWPASLTKRWEVAAGAGHSSPVISGNRVVLHARDGEREVVRAIDLDTGRDVWRNDYAAPYTMNPAASRHGPGPKSTPVVGGGRVITFGISGILSAYDLATGKRLWRMDAPPVPPTYGTAMSPVLDGNLLIAHVGGENKGALTAFDAATGACAGDGQVMVPHTPRRSSPTSAAQGRSSRRHRSRWSP